MIEVIYLKKIEEANHLIQELKNKLNSISGVEKLIRKIRSEIQVLEKSYAKGILKEENLVCSNLGHLGSIANFALSAEGLVSILKPFTLPSGRKITCDFIAHEGASWYKVILRNPKALHHIFVSGNKNATRPLHKVAQDFLTASHNNLYLFNPPSITFVLVSGISESLAVELNSIGISTKGQVIPDDELQVPDYGENESSSLSSSESEGDIQDPTFSNEIEHISASPFHRITCVNLDVTSLIAYVSSTTNGNCNLRFADGFLSQQASWERTTPAKQVLDRYFEDRELILIEEAADHFKTILDTIGGPLEKQRAAHILKQCKIVPSIDIFKDDLPIGGRVKELSRKIFGTGHALKAPTVTSNKGFSRAASNKGIQISVLYHEPRALTEQKEISAASL